jgi:phage terminase small subunit
MGLRGPAKKPSALELAEGKPGHRAVSDNEPRFAEGVPTRPSGLSRAACAIWRDTIDIMMTVPGLLTVADGAVLADFCEVRAQKDSIRTAMMTQKRAAAQQIRTAASARGTKISLAEAEAAAETALIERYGGELNRLRHRENVLRRELGLSPSSRSSIRLGDVTPRSKPSALDGALFGGPRLVRV